MAANMAAIREKVEKKKRDKEARRSSIKREPSPITMRASGGVIDLTLSD